MERWRERALEALPELCGELENERDVFSPYALWFELLARIHGLAEWCRTQPVQEIWNSAGVAFYEHLFDEPWMRPQVPRWLSDEAVRDAWGLWECRLDAEAMDEVRRLLRSRQPDRRRS